MEYAIEIDNFSKSFGIVKSVKNLTLSVKYGEIYGFLGPNGAGKSTTIKTLVGIYNKDQGIIKIDGKDISDLSYKKYIGYIPDEPYIYEGLTPKQLLSFFAELYSIPKKEIEEKVNKALKYFYIDEDLNLQVQDFSRGSKQKLVISAAFMHNPKVLIIDEPMVGLDPISSIKFIKYIKDFAKSGGAVFVSTHDLDIASKLCDRVGIINKGKLIIEGSIKEIEKLTNKSNLDEVFFSVINEE